MGNCWGGPGQADNVLLSEEVQGPQVAIGENQPLLHEAVVWSADVPLTEGQLRGKRDTFWDTAPVYEGRKEIWDALRAAVEAAEQGDYDLAQAIVEGANVSLPTGRLTQAYDELGNRYIIPNYCLSKPTNYQDALTPSKTETAEEGKKTRQTAGTPLTLKVRLSTVGKDVKVTLMTEERVSDIKQRLHETHGVEPLKTTMLYAGRVLKDSTPLKELKIPRGHVIQAVVS